MPRDRSNVLKVDEHAYQLISSDIAHIQYRPISAHIERARAPAQSGIDPDSRRTPTPLTTGQTVRGCRPLPLIEALSEGFQRLRQKSADVVEGLVRQPSQRHKPRSHRRGCTNRCGAPNPCGLSRLRTRTCARFCQRGVAHQRRQRANRRRRIP